MATVIEPLANAMFRWNWRTSIRCCTRFRQMRKNFIKILAGDKVAVELSPYDLTRDALCTDINDRVCGP